MSAHLLEQPQGYDYEPILDASVEGLGEVYLKSIRLTGHTDDVVRRHRLYSIALDTFGYGAEITDPADGVEADYVIMSFPGFTEHIEGGFRQAFQQHLAEAFPQARIISVSSDGIGRTGDRYGPLDAAKHSLQAMGQARRTLARALAADKPVYTQGTSMGSVVEHHFKTGNLTEPIAVKQIDHRGAMLLSPAIVDPMHALEDMGLHFIPQMTYHSLRELVTRSRRLEAAEIMTHALHYGLARADALAMACQAGYLLCGTPRDEVEAGVAAVPTAVVAGTQDCLANWDMWRQFAGRYPDTVQLYPIRNHGHELAIKAGKVCAKLSVIGHQMIDQPGTMSSAVSA